MYVYVCNRQYILREVNAPLGMCMRRRHTTKTPATKRIKHKTETCLRLIAVMKFINLSTRQRVAPVLLRYCTALPPSYDCVNFANSTISKQQTPSWPVTNGRTRSYLFRPSSTEAARTVSHLYYWLGDEIVCGKWFVKPGNVHIVLS